MVYLNHAATTYPKPKEVAKRVARSLTEPPQSQYRGVMSSDSSQDIKKLCREKLAVLFGIPDSERIFFTSGSTQSLNTAILGLETKRKGIVITATEHNAILRTVMDGLKEKLVDGEYHLTIIPCDDSGYVHMDAMQNALNTDTALVVVNHSSNVTGAVQDIGTIGKWAKEAGAYYLVDASQSAGTIPIDVQRMHIDMLAFTAHKGLYGIEGCGGLYLRAGIPLRPLLYGGTGKESRTLIPEEPYYEVGTANILGITALHAGVEFILRTGQEKIAEKNQKIMSRLYKGLIKCPGVIVYAARQPKGTVLSFNLKNLSPGDVGYILSGSYQIVVRTGLHCSPMIHQYLGSDKEGTVRVSISYLTTEAEIDYFLQAIRSIAVGSLE